MTETADTTSGGAPADALATIPLATIAEPQAIGVGEFPDALRLVGDGPGLDRYHAWLEDPESDEVDGVRSGLGRYGPLADLVAYTVGLTDTLPSASTEAPAELRALIASAHASDALDADDLPGAARLLREAADLARPVSPDLALSLAISAAEVHQSLGNADHTRAAEAQADEALSQSLLRSAMGHYYAGLQLVAVTTAPETWAALQLDLATAQLASPMRQATDQLRVGIAAQALRACRQVFTPERHPGPWSIATINLANALVYMPSTHQGDNVVEAVELYEEVLSSGVREDDAAGKARLLANQGNALAHLGIFDQATAKLVEARFLFESVLDHDGAFTVRQVLDEIAKASIGFDPATEMDDLARQAEQMSRMPADGMGRTAGMGVTISAAMAPPAEAQRRATVTILSRESE